MKSHKALALLAALTASSPAVYAQDYGLEVGPMNCGQYFDKLVELQKTSPQSANVQSFWLFGYISYLHGNTTISMQLFDKFNKALLFQCSKDWNQPLLKTAAAVPFER